MIILANAFSINMLVDDCTVHFERIDQAKVLDRLTSEPWQSSIGHPATAAVLSSQLGIEVPCNRSTVSLNPFLVMIVAQVTMPRMAEGQVLSEEEMKRVPIAFWEVLMDK